MEGDERKSGGGVEVTEVEVEGDERENGYVG